MFALSIALFHVVAAGTLDLEMTPQEKKKTGVYRLTDAEKSSLQQWIDARYEKRSASLSQEAIVPQRSLLQEVLRNGTYIRLSNGTLWNIDPDDTNVSQGWITPVDILVTQSGDPSYPYKLTNSLTGSSIRARKVDKIPNS